MSSQAFEAPERAGRRADRQADRRASGSYAIIKEDISTLYKDMSYLKSCKLTSLTISFFSTSSSAHSLLASHCLASLLITVITTGNWKEGKPQLPAVFVVAGVSRVKRAQAAQTFERSFAGSVRRTRPAIRPIASQHTWRRRGGRERRLRLLDAWSFSRVRKLAGRPAGRPRSNERMAVRRDAGLRAGCRCDI